MCLNFRISESTINALGLNSMEPKETKRLQTNGRNPHKTSGARFDTQELLSECYIFGS